MIIKYLSIIVLSLLWGNNIFAKTITLSKCYVNIMNDFDINDKIRKLEENISGASNAFIVEALKKAISN